MRATMQLLAVGVFCLHASQLLGCGRVITTVGESTEANISAGSAAGDGAGDGNGTAGTMSVGQAGRMGAAGAPAMLPDNTGKCVFEPLDAERHPLEMYIMMDSNVTLAAGLWELAVDGLRRFARDPRSAGIHVGVRYYGSACDADTYATPSVAVAPLPDNYLEIVTTAKNLSNGNVLFMASEMLPALKGGIQYETARARAMPEAKHVVVLLSDGFATDLNIACPIYSPEDVIGAARAGYSQKPQIETYVVELDVMPLGFNVDAFAARFQKLKEVAAAGGTQAISVGSVDVPVRTNESLQTVRRRAQPCDYLLPPGTDTAKVGMALVEGYTSTTEIARTKDADGCGDDDGWYFDDAANPTRLMLCPHSCTLVRSSDSYSVAPLSGCKPITR